MSLNAINFRQYAGNKHGQVDDTPYGGGGGMVLKPDPIFAVEDILASNGNEIANHDDVANPAGSYRRKSPEQPSLRESF